MSPEELLVEDRYDMGDGEAVGYAEVDEPMEIEAGDVRERQ